ncbi:MAG TPA: hypothetical protein VNM90_12050 [Haliangium sp.]|nr:hypothetical protein [Haliangium sp.]
MSCGPSTPGRPPGHAPAPPGAGARPLPWSPDPDGRWRWTLVTEEAGTRRVEVETWHIATRGDALAGTLARTVTFLSTDGTPFTCNQALAYRQDALIRLEGGRDAGGFWLRETEHSALPSPCDDGQRARLHYRGRWADGALALTWDGGSQTLRPLPAPGAHAGQASEAQRVEPHRLPGGIVGTDVPAPRSGPPGPPGAAEAPATSPSAAGAWRWQGRSTRPDTGEVRVEIEDWAVEEDAAGQVTGTVTQTVTVFDRDGRVFGCSGDTFYQVRDRYSVRGQRRGQDLALHEIAVEPDTHPCVQGASRHLDDATGGVVGAHLVLTWRGQRRQVLHRP